MNRTETLNLYGKMHKLYEKMHKVLIRFDQELNDQLVEDMTEGIHSSESQEAAFDICDAVEQGVKEELIND